MSQRLLPDVSASREDHIAHLADIVLREGEIVSDQRPFRIKRDDVVTYIETNIHDEIPVEAFVNSWQDEEGEADTAAHAAMLEFTVRAANECLDVVFTDHQCDLMQWGPAQ